jgi:hypothetical protein
MVNARHCSTSLLVIAGFLHHVAAGLAVVGVTGDVGQG